MNNNSNHSSFEAEDQVTDFGFRKVDQKEKPSMVKAVFDSVAPKYDIMNDLMSLGIHRVWKQIFIQELAPRPNLTLLDLAGGTGDISFGWLKRGGGTAYLTDINYSMLSVGQGRALNRGYVDNIRLFCVDGENICLPDRSVDRVTISFGLRNCTHKENVLAEARRVLKPGGRFLCLEFSKLIIPMLRPLYDAWSFQALPRIGQIIAKDSESYQYLAESIRTFPDQETLKSMMENAGLERVTYQNLSGGIAAIHSGWRI
ncbi:class I SAM-dependent methyltransferase [Commensalibacter oyaizuii]|uniref:Ubiquinone/menaquinone biosynthesis C-methyltransferase UbiE n=1 Tax=Commensalibacter oyaizuii TaxID=3043873 RepID=A0ABT6Q1E0_9PROT|nr:class I SAM-dependent methyltransferase [Commensalibacter sp. TBRC 16381]MDI2090299.1 class I SAM-dependent methyltransferase [Commensalibacter sp. TBRC 16381]